MTAVTHYIRREQKDAHIKEWRGIKVDGLHVEDRLQVFQAAVDAVQVLVQLTPGAQNQHFSSGARKSGTSLRHQFLFAAHAVVKKQNSCT